jgi:hypothetical protein
MMRPCATRKEENVRKVKLEGRRGKKTHVGSLVVLDDAAESTLSGAEGTVEHVNVDLLRVALLLDTATNLEGTGFCEEVEVSECKEKEKRSKGRTVVGAVRDGDELLVFSLMREPRLKVVLLRRRVVERTRNDRDELVGKTKGLVERLRVGDHRVEHLPRRARVGDAELLDLFKLVHTEDTENVATGGTGFLAEAGRVTGVLDRELFVRLVEPLVGVHGGNRLLRSRNEVLLLVLVRALELSRVI